MEAAVARAITWHRDEGSLERDGGQLCGIVHAACPSPEVAKHGKPVTLVEQPLGRLIYHLVGVDDDSGPHGETGDRLSGK